MPVEEVQELSGMAAQDYARGHLQQISVDTVGWTTTYCCPESGHQWLMDYPHSEVHGGGPPKLRRI